MVARFFGWESAGSLGGLAQEALEGLYPSGHGPLTGLRLFEGVPVLFVKALKGRSPEKRIGIPN